MAKTKRGKRKLGKAKQVSTSQPIPNEGTIEEPIEKSETNQTNNSLSPNSITTTKPLPPTDNIKQTLTLKELMSKSLKLNHKVITDLKYALSNDYTLLQACRYARINPDTYYEWSKASDEFKLEMEAAKDNMLTLARKTIHKAVKNGDARLSLDYLERREPNVYGKKTQVTGENGEPIQINHVLTSLLKEIDGNDRIDVTP